MPEQKKVLIVDDSVANADLLEALLVNFNFMALKAYSGEEALSLTEKESPDLVLMDVMMPGMSGFQVCEKLRENPSFSNVPIIIVTAKAKEESDIIESLEKGVDDYIFKPVNGEDLSKKVSILLAKAKKGELPSQYYLELQKARKEGMGNVLTDYCRLCNLDS